MAVLAQSAACRSQAAYMAVEEQRCSTLHTIRTPSRDGTQGEAITLRVADSEEHRNLAADLINRMYSWRGYGSHHQLAAAPQSATFTASCDEEVVGTLTLTVDSAGGLAADKTFKEELAPLRAAGAKLCELTKFAFDSSEPSKHALAALFHSVLIYGSQKYDCTDIVIEVNPRHRRFYETMLGFKRIGSMKANDSVGAPAQLMWLSVSDIRRRIDESMTDGRTAARSLYPYFFSRAEERDIYARLNDAEAFDPPPFTPGAAQIAAMGRC